jgi:hypothetical protein
VFTTRDHTPALAQAETMCRTVGPDAAVLFLDGPSKRLMHTMAAMCDTVAGSTPEVMAPEVLGRVQASAAAHGRDFFVLSTQPALIPYRDGSIPAPTTAYPFTAWQEEIVRVPYRTRRARPGYWVARIGADGRAEPVSAQ